MCQFAVSWSLLLDCAQFFASLVLVLFSFHNTWNSSVQDFAPGTLLRDLRFFVGLLAVFLVLSILDRIIEFVKAKLGGGH